MNYIFSRKRIAGKFIIGQRKQPNKRIVHREHSAGRGSCKGLDWELNSAVEKKGKLHQITEGIEVTEPVC